jgi:hypothetical protein
MSMLLALLLQDYVLRTPQTTAVAAFGAFRLEREECVERPGVGVLHYAHCFPKARLIWSSADGRVSARYEDNGGLLTRAYQFPFRPDTAETCYIGASLTAYRARPATAADWQGSTRAFGAMLTQCSAFGPQQVAAYQAEFTTAAVDYRQAAAGLRSLAVSLFHNLRRCTRQKISSRHNDAEATVTCTRKEGPLS